MEPIYKPNSKVTGHACSFKYSEKDRCVYVNMIKQATWDDSKKRGTFGKNSKDPKKTCNIKLSSDEMCGLIHAIESNSEFKIFHSNPNQKTMGSFKPYVREDNEGNREQKGFGFSLSKQTNDGDKISFIISLGFDQAVKIKTYFNFCLTRIFLAIEKEDEAWKDKGNGYSKSKSDAPTKSAPKPKVESDPLEEEPPGIDEDDW